MSQTQVILQGTLTADGTLLLDAKPNLPPGRVQVVVQTENWWSYLQRCRAELEAAGASFRSGPEIEGDVEQIRGESERVDGIRWEQEWARHHPESPSC